MKRARGNEYIDRSAILAKNTKLPNVLPEVKAFSCDNLSCKSRERQFNYKLVVEDDVHMLMGMMLSNEICVLMFNEELYRKQFGPNDDVVSVVFHESLRETNFSGKKKKGAQVLAAGKVVATITLLSGVSIELKAPVGGQILEINDELLTNSPHLFTTNRGYPLVLFPDTELPRLNSAYLDGAALIEKARNTPKNVCFAFRETGTCSRGEKCKFAHIPNEDKGVENNNSNSSINNSHEVTSSKTVVSDVNDED